jgi:hypothetical protein
MNKTAAPLVISAGQREALTGAGPVFDSGTS